MFKNRKGNFLSSRSKNAYVNLDALKVMHYSDFNLGDEDDFKPEDIIDEDDDSDDSLLEQFSKNPEPEISLPKEKVVLSSNKKNIYNEKVVNIKKNIKKNFSTPREDSVELPNMRSQRKPPKEKSMIGRYHHGRNVRNISQAAQ